MNQVLLIEDDPAITDLLRLALIEAGVELQSASDLATARTRLAEIEYDAILLDLNLPDGSGIDLCREIRSSSTIPILILTARRDEIDRILGLELGADDYIVKPFSPREVTARLRAVLRRQNWAAAEPTGSVREVAGISVDEVRREVRVDGESVSLTRTEFQLVVALTSRPGRVFSRAELIDHAWEGAFIQDRVVDSVISRVRRKLGRLPNGESRIRTVHGVGYSCANG